MLKICSRSMFAALAPLVLACAGDTPTKPIDERSLVLAYTTETGSQCHIVLSDVDGGTRSIPNVCATGLAWSPDGQRIAFNLPGGEAAPPSLWIMNVDGSGKSEVAGGRALVDPDWSPDGTRLATINLSTGFMETMRVDGSERVELPAAGLYSYGRPSWSPDGSEILFARFDTLWVVNVSSGAAHVQAVPALHGITEPRWSPDGSRISLDAAAPNRLGVYVVNADGSNPLLLADGSIDGGAAPWSADGSQLVFESALGDGTTVDIYVVASDGSSAARNVTHNSNGKASFSPDWARSR